MSGLPTDLKYTESHEWIRVEEDGSLTMGITEHAQELLGDMVFIEPPEAGREVEAGEACAVVESVKAASDVYSPVAGEIVGGNEALENAPEAVNSDPYGDGWILSVKPTNAEDVDALMDADAYSKFIEAENH